MRNKPYDLYTLPRIENLKDMLLQKAETKPEHIAFTFSKGKNQLIEKSYRNFYEEVNALGTWIWKEGLQGKQIAIIGENSYEWLLCFFAIVNGGSVAVPIDKELPQKEIMKLIHKSDAEAVFVSTSYLNVVGDMGINVYSMADMNHFLEKGNEQIKDGRYDFLDYSIDSEKLCCIMFTSGTSGSSKGVMLSHRNIAEDINGSCKLFVLEGNTIALLPFHHAFGLVVGVFMVFNYGYTIFLNKSLKTVQRDLQVAKPQTMFLVPLFVETFHKQIWTQAKKEGKDKILRIMMKVSDCLLFIGIDIRKKVFASVRKAFGGKLSYIICGGAPLMPQYIKEFRSFGVEILNGYGTTECSPCAAVNRNYFHRDGTVGIPVPGVKVKLSEDGEVLIKGLIVMQGYYKDEESTKQAITDGWYRTGDLGVIDADGFLTLTGRKKNLIILSNGENISPEELETDFLKDEAVQEVLVYEKEGKIIAEIFPNEEWFNTLHGDNIGENRKNYLDELCKKVNRGRPLYKQIHAVIIRDAEFPKNTSKKILRY